MQVLSQFRNLSFRELNRRPLTLQVGEITKSSPRRTHCKLCIRFFGWDLEGTGADYIFPAPLHQPPNYPPKPPCITGSVTTPPNSRPCLPQNCVVLVCILVLFSALACSTRPNIFQQSSRKRVDLLSNKRAN